jgi:broad specificity phosphatase PhoE
VDGWADPPLGEEGRRSLSALARRLAPLELDALFTAPSTRARQSADVLAAGRTTRPVVVEELREVHHGSYEGRTFPDLSRTGDPVFVDFARRRSWSVFPGGEGDDRFRRRCAAALDRMRDGRAGAARVVAVSHGGVINALLADLLRIPDPIFFMPRGGSISVVLVDGETVTLVSANDCRHLADPLLTDELPLIHRREGGP